jgi:hypothetical protein
MLSTSPQMDLSAAIAISPNRRKMGRRLRDLLRGEARLQHRLLALATESREAIIARDIARLLELEREHKSVLNDAEQAAAQRLQWSVSIARACGVPEANLTMSRVCDALPPEVALEIGITGKLLLEVAQDVRAAHALNRELLENELEHIGLSLEVVARAAASVAAATRSNATGAAGRPLPGVNAASILLDQAA